MEDERPAEKVSERSKRRTRPARKWSERIDADPEEVMRVLVRTPREKIMEDSRSFRAKPEDGS